jgi:hypothetical protein
MPGGGLDGMICSCHAAGPCEHKVAAVLAFQVERGTRVIAVEEVALSASADAPRSRDQILSAVGQVVGELVVLGLSRLSRATPERLRTLAVSAHGVDLPRLEHLLRGLATEIDLALSRDAQADAANLLAQAARVDALRRGLVRRPSAHLIGQHQTAYEPVGDLELVGLGARAWRTGTGFSGLTVYFWDRSADSIATWTDARPLTIAGFDPVARFRAEGPWSGLTSPAEASRKALRVVGAWRNRQGRLSGRPGTRALALGPSPIDQIPARVDDWSTLVPRVRRVFGGGFHDRCEQDAVVLLAPAQWGPGAFDPVRQEQIRVVWDKAGRPLALALRHERGTEDAVTTLGAHDSSDTRSVLGLLRLGAGRLSVEPIALHTAGGPINLTVDGATQGEQGTMERLGDQADDDVEDQEAAPVVEPSATNLGRLLALISVRLLAAGEGGLAAFRGISELRGLVSRAEAVGLAACGFAVRELVDSLESQRRGELMDPMPVARALLAAYHVVHLALVEEAVAAATAGLQARVGAQTAVAEASGPDVSSEDI